MHAHMRMRARAHRQASWDSSSTMAVRGMATASFKPRPSRSIDVYSLYLPRLYIPYISLMYCEVYIYIYPYISLYIPYISLTHRLNIAYTSVISRLYNGWR